MLARIVPVALAVSATYSLAAGLAYQFYFSAHPEQLTSLNLVFALFGSIIPTWPYLLLLVVYRAAHDRTSQVIAILAILAAVLLAAWAYSDAFWKRQEPDMFGLVFLFAPAIQSLVGFLAWAPIAWRRVHASAP